MSDPSTPLPSPPAAILPSGAWDGREAFSALIRLALGRAAIEGWSLMILSDPDFSDWPLGERGVVEALQAWARKGREIHLISQDFRWMREHAPRFVQWRVNWDHIVQARACKGVVAEGLPSGLWTPQWSLERMDVAHCRGLSTDDPKRRTALRERMDGCWRQASVSFPASVLGL